MCGVEAWLRTLPNRAVLPDAALVGSAHATPLEPAVIPGTSAARMWTLRADDPRFGGISALAIEGKQLLGLTDAGVVIRFIAPDRPSQPLRFSFHDLPDGPGPSWRKASRDSESLLARDGSWWVGFETHHSLWHYDRGFTHALGHRWLDVPWPPNVGAEGMVTDGPNAVALLPEGGGSPLVIGRGTASLGAIPIGTSDATHLPDGRLAILVRRVGMKGFTNQLRIAAGNGHRAMTIALPMGRLANAEAVAAAPLPNGGTRLWIATDDNFRPWMRTLLLALDLPPGA